MAERAQNLKITLIGDVSVGKTSLITRVFYGTFEYSTPTTVGASFYTGSATSTDGKKFKLQVWDTAGQERFRSLIPMYIRGTDVIFFVYDLNDVDSFRNITNYWVNYIQQSCFDEEPISFLIGTKSDLLSENRLTNALERINIEHLNEGFFSDFYIVSSLDGTGTEDLIVKMLDQVVKKRASKFREPPDSIINFDNLSKFNNESINNWCCI